MSTKPPKVKLSKDAFKKARRVFVYVKPYRIPYITSFIFLVLTSMTTMLFPMLMGKMVESQNKTTTAFNLLDFENINSLVLLLFIVFAAQSVFSFFRIYFGTIVVEGAMKDLRADAFQKLVTMPMDFFNRNKVGELTSRISSDIQLLHETLSVTLTEFIRQFIIVVIGIAFLAFISIKLSLIMLATIPVVALIAVFFGRFIKKLSKTVQDRVAESNLIVEESLTGIVNVKSFSNEIAELFKYRSQINEVHKLSLKNAVWRGAFVSFIIFFMFGAITFLAWQGVSMMNSGEISGGELSSFIITTVLIGISFGSIPELYAKIQRTIGGTEKLMDLLDLVPEKITMTEHKSSVKTLKGKIEFANVNFSYPTRDDVEVIKNISFTIQPGQQIALVGSSGSGKSTIVSLLLQFYHNYEGKILYDDKPATDYELSFLRDHMAMVPQDVILFSGTIRENISYGKPNASEDEIRAAAQQANALDFIESFPQGFETLVGDRGIQLSGGQKQRIAIARAVLKDPVILLLDEATSSLDSESERLVQDALDKLMQGRTTIVVAHRLSTIRNVDKILVFENGTISESGNHAELVVKSGKYNKLYTMQTNS
jgi:ABC-type multidrug transport system fused ATPase/permease subunit